MNNKTLTISGNQDVLIPAHLNFGKFILDRIRRYGDELAFENPETGEKLTYKEMTEYAVKLSVALTKLGVRKGDVVALGSEKRLMFVPTALAIILSGATYTPYDFTSGKAHLKHKLEITEPKYFICTELFWKTNKEILQSSKINKTFITLDKTSDNLITVESLIRANADVDVNSFEPVTVQGQVDTVVIVYSSGTTGMPKGVQMSHLKCILDAIPHEPCYNEDSIKAAYITGDWFHNYDSVMTYKMLALGKKVVFTTDISPETLVMAFEKGQVNIVFLVPSLVHLLAKTETNENENLKCFKYVYCSASPIHLKTMQKLKERFPSLITVLQGYGMTETWEITSECWSTKGPRMGSVGCVCPCITIKVENPETQELLGPNQRGQICVKGPAFTKIYIGIDPSTYMDEEGWFRTGDLGYYDEDGFFYIVDRLKEIIDFDGYKVAPLELETILLLHPGVREAGVVGKPVPVYGEEPTAFVVRQQGSDVTEQELIDFLAAEVAPYMQLRGGVIFMSKLPRNPRGKLLRRQLRDMLNSA